MPIETKYDSTIDAIVMKATGKITYEDISDLAENLVAHPEFRMNINQLFDNTDGEFDLSTNEIERIAQDFMSISELLGQERRFAVAVSRDVDYGMMRQYEVFFQADPEVEVRGFRSLDEARQWLQTNRMGCLCLGADQAN